MVGEGVVTGDGLDAAFTIRLSDHFRLDIDLAIPPGRTVALLGPNGAGKSTAVATIAGLLAIGSGRISLGGEILDAPELDVFVPAALRRVGVVFQDYLLFPHLTVLDNVAFGLRTRRIPRGEASALAHELISRFGLEGMEGAKPSELSGGQSQRVALARALAAEPRMLLLDEPLSALDVTTRARMRHTLADHLRDFSGPRLLISHDPTDALLLADEIHILEDGVITQTGTADDILLRPRTQYAADLAGSNLLEGMAHGGAVDVGTAMVHIADRQIEGPVLISIRAAAISLHLDRPEGSQRNSWSTTIWRVEQMGSRVRIRTGPPLPLTVEVTEGSRGELGLEPGRAVWIAFKATEIGVQPG